MLMASDRYQRCNGLQRERYPLDPRTGIDHQRMEAFSTGYY